MRVACADSAIHNRDPYTAICTASASHWPSVMVWSAIRASAARCVKRITVRPVSAEVRRLGDRELVGLVQGRRRLVQHQHLGVGQQRPRQRNPLALSSAKESVRARPAMCRSLAGGAGFARGLRRHAPRRSSPHRPHPDARKEYFSRTVAWKR